MACDENKITCILETINHSISEKHQIAASGCSYVQTEYAEYVILFIKISGFNFFYKYKINELYICMYVCIYASALNVLKISLPGLGKTPRKYNY